MLDGLLTEENVPPHSSSELYEKYFVFACIWAFGGPLPSDGRIDYRNMFSNWWKKELQTVKIAETGVCCAQVTLDGGANPSQNLCAMHRLPFTGQCTVHSEPQVLWCVCARVCTVHSLWSHKMPVLAQACYMIPSLHCLQGLFSITSWMRAKISSLGRTSCPS